MFAFCPKCKSILRPTKQGEKLVLACSCGYSQAGSATVKEDKQVKKEEAAVAVVDRDIETLPICKEECPKCGNKEAYYWLVQTRSGDEAETKFLKCTKCKHTWRDYK
jgi:DNA-directed RNA polymerase subunit M